MSTSIETEEGLHSQWWRIMPIGMNKPEFEGPLICPNCKQAEADSIVFAPYCSELCFRFGFDGRLPNDTIDLIVTLLKSKAGDKTGTSLTERIIWQSLSSSQ